MLQVFVYGAVNKVAMLVYFRSHPRARTSTKLGKFRGTYDSRDGKNRQVGLASTGSTSAKGAARNTSTQQPVASTSASASEADAANIAPAKSTDAVATDSADSEAKAGLHTPSPTAVSSTSPEVTSGTEVRQEQALAAAEEVATAVGDTVSNAINAATQAAAAAAADISKVSRERPGSSKATRRASEPPQTSANADASRLNPGAVVNADAVDRQADPAPRVPSSVGQSGFTNGVKRSKSAGSFANVVLSASKSARQAIMASRDDTTAPQSLRKSLNSRNSASAARPASQPEAVEPSTPTDRDRIRPVSKQRSRVAPVATPQVSTAATQRDTRAGDGTPGVLAQPAATPRGTTQASQSWRRAASSVKAEPAEAGGSGGGGATYVSQARELYFDAGTDSLWKAVRLPPQRPRLPRRRSTA